MALSRRLAPAAAAFVITVAALVPSVLSLPPHGDENHYAWTAAYYGTRLTHLDFRPDGTDPVLDPGWAPFSWPITQPMGARLIYAIALGVTGSPPPALPLALFDPSAHAAELAVPEATLLVLRFTAVLCAALGFGLFAVRWGWRGAVPLVLLAVPDTRDDLARAWAEGPLLLGFGLCALAYGTRWFAAVCGLAATFKLTALGLWPLAFWRGSIGHSRLAHLLGLAVAAAVWCALTPPSWYAGGPLYLTLMLIDRQLENSRQAATVTHSAAVFIPTRYLWPFEIVVVFGLVWLAPRTWGMIRDANMVRRLTRRPA
jgi:hypothetical protein